MNLYLYLETFKSNFPEDEDDMYFEEYKVQFRVLKDRCIVYDVCGAGSRPHGQYHRGCNITTGSCLPAILTNQRQLSPSKTFRGLNKILV